MGLRNELSKKNSCVSFLHLTFTLFDHHVVCFTEIPGNDDLI